MLWLMTFISCCKNPLHYLKNQSLSFKNISWTKQSLQESRSRLTIILSVHSRCCKTISSQRVDENARICQNTWQSHSNHPETVLPLHWTECSSWHVISAISYLSANMTLLPYKYYPYKYYPNMIEKPQMRNRLSYQTAEQGSDMNLCTLTNYMTPRSWFRQGYQE